MTGERFVPDRRLVEAIARGEVTKGGMAEAGWFEIGTFTDGDSLWIRRLDDE